jgi:hypothetical protein
MQPDYPAAHSMDTCFFAIDRDGRVACFDTGEAGALPTRALSGESAYSVRRQLAELPRVEVIHDRQGRLTPGGRNEFNEHRGRLGLPYPTLMFLASLEPVADDIAAGRAVQVSASEGVAVLFREMSEELAERLHRSGSCLACTWSFQDDEERRPDPAARGIYLYSHLTENWIAGPYGLVSRPAQPIHIDQLPPRLRRSIQALRFDSLSFAETPHIQPVEHAECEAWDPAYLDATGTRTRAIPGKEAEYAEIYKDLAEANENLHVEPPAAPGDE